MYLFRRPTTALTALRAYKQKLTLALQTSANIVTFENTLVAARRPTWQVRCDGISLQPDLDN